MNQPLAYVHPGAKSKNVVIEPFTTIHIMLLLVMVLGSNVTIMKAQELEKIVIYFRCNIRRTTGFKIWRKKKQ
jgi:hypothetical protein